ncbi:alpha-amanitin target [Murmansk poxvirus]|uniref:Alpha-amanitin target n=1 Tax=Murmansk poxvirus TaxID=2025359 RepID=A0A223FML5_9POXV|nr:alpha-amanitin target [Murmansk poxvirus]AST09222.1 alpha-amanitin target [Murmansk poxvirus]
MDNEMDKKISTIIRSMHIDDISEIVNELDLPKQCSIDFVIDKTCEVMRDRWLTKMYMIELINYMPFSKIVSLYELRGYFKLVKAYLSIIKNINIDVLGPLFKEFMSYDKLAIEHYGVCFIRNICKDLLKKEEHKKLEGTVDDYDDDTFEFERMYDVNLYRRMKRSADGNYIVDPVSFTQKVFGFTSILAKNGVANGIYVFSLNIDGNIMRNFIPYLKNKFRV